MLSVRTKKTKLMRRDQTVSDCGVLPEITEDMRKKVHGSTREKMCLRVAVDKTYGRSLRSHRFDPCWQPVIVQVEPNVFQ